jgi:hypothetical protein
MLPGVVRWSLVLLLELVETHWDHPSLKGSPAGLLDRQDIIEALHSDLAAQLLV